MLKLGIIRWSSSSWSSPLHMLAKKSGDWHPCGDYTALNNITNHDRYLVPHIQVFTATVHRSATLSKLDPERAYHQIQVEPADIQKMAIAATSGLYKFVKMSVGLRNAAQTIQHFISQVLRGLLFTYAYIDDVLVASSGAEEHKQHFCSVFWLLNKYGVIINPLKCVFGVEELTFLRHHVSSKGFQPLEDKVHVVQEFPWPTTQHKLRELLGLINLYHWFLNHEEAILKHPNNLLSTSLGQQSFHKELLVFAGSIYYCNIIPFNAVVVSPGTTEHNGKEQNNCFFLSQQNGMEREWNSSSHSVAQDTNGNFLLTPTLPCFWY